MHTVGAFMISKFSQVLAFLKTSSLRGKCSFGFLLPSDGAFCVTGPRRTGLTGTRDLLEERTHVQEQKPGLVGLGAFGAASQPLGS